MSAEKRGSVQDAISVVDVGTGRYVAFSVAWRYAPNIEINSESAFDINIGSQIHAWRTFWSLRMIA